MNYPAKVASYARHLYEAGWMPKEIQRILKDELSVTPDRSTVRRWVDPAWAERRRLGQRIEPWRQPYERLKELREVGLSTRSVALLIAHEFKIPITASQVRCIVQGEVTEPTVHRLLAQRAAA